jgi:hypothetical protein
MSEVRARDSRRDEAGCLELDLEEEDFEEEDLEEEEDLDLEDLVLSDATSRMFRRRPVVGSVVESSPGLWETW